MTVLSLQEILLGPTASPDHRVDALSLLRKLQEIEASNASGNRVYYEDTLANLTAVSGPPAGSTGFVLDDSGTPANNGVYLRGESSWSKTAELPGAFSDSLAALAAVAAEAAARESADDALTDALALKRNIADPIDDAQLAQQPEGTVKGRRAGAGTGTVQQITFAQLRLDAGIDSAIAAAVAAEAAARESADDALAATLATLGDLATEDDIPSSLINDSTAAGRSLLTAADAAAQRTALGLVIGTNVQAYDADLAAIGGLTSAADRLPYYTGAATAALAVLTTAGRALLDDADAAAQRTTLGITAAGDALMTAADAAAQRTALGVTTAGSAIVTAVDADAQITALGGTASGSALFKAANAAAQRTALDLDMLDTANDAVILGGETRVENSDYLLVIEDPNTGAVFAYVDADGNAEGFGADTSATETEPLVAAKYSTDWTWFTSDVLAIIVGHGQSNARGQGTTATSTTPVYPGRALMPSNGPQVTGATGQALVDLVEVGTETPGSALVNNLIAKVEALTGSQPYVCYLNGAVSATPLRNLNRGSTAWTNIMGGIEDAVAWARSNGLIPVVLGMTWTQGEEGSDRPRAPAEYLADLDNLSRDFAADVKARTGQTYDPRLYATQIYSGHNNEPTDLEWSEWGPNVAVVEGHGRGLARLSGPMYQLEIQTADYLHLTAVGQYAQGAMQAEAIYADWVGAGWSPIRPLRAWMRTTSIVRIEYAVPGGGDLSIVTGGPVTDTTNSTKGFQVFTAGRGSKLTISSVAVPTMTDVNDRYVDITLSAPVTGGVFVTYAMRRDTNGQNGPATGGRGCLATATTYTPLSGGAQRHWAAAHSITVGV